MLAFFGSICQKNYDNLLISNYVRLILLFTETLSRKEICDLSFSSFVGQITALWGVTSQFDEFVLQSGSKSKLDLLFFRCMCNHSLLIAIFGAFF
jgi:hypothetical protein